MADERFDALLRAHEAQTRHLAAERARVAEQLEELQTALDRERDRGDRATTELDAERATRRGVEEEVDRLRAEVERADRENGHLQQRYDSVLQMRAVRWSAPVRSLKRRLLGRS